MIPAEDPELRAYLQNARTAFEQGNFVYAAEIFKYILDCAPDTLDARVGLFETLTQLGEFTHAREHLDRALAISPYNVELRITRSSIAINLGEYAIAADDLAVAIPAAPAFVPLWTAYLSAVAIAERPEEALSKVRSLGVDPPNDLSLSIEFARIELHAGERSEAEYRIKAIVAENPQDPDRLLLQAKFLMEIGEDFEAQEVFDRLRTQTPNSVPVLLAAAFAEQHDNASVAKALVDLRHVLELQPDNTEALRMAAECLARIARYSEAIVYMKKYLEYCGVDDPVDTFFYAKLLKNNNKITQSSEMMEQTADQLSRLLRQSKNNPEEAHATAAKLARLEIARGRKMEAKRLFDCIAKNVSETRYNYSSTEYLPDTEARIESLKRIIGGRDVFLLAHGPSISELSSWIEQFAENDFCIAAVSAFRLLERAILWKIDRNVEITLQTHYRGIAPRYDHLQDFLTRDENNLFITARWALDRLGRSRPTRRGVEKIYDAKLLYIGESGGIQPATPANPLGFVFGNSLSILVPLMSMGGAKRIFIFGADGVAPNAMEQAHHFGQDNPDYRFDFDATDLDALTGGLRADTIDFDEAVEIGLMSQEALYGFKRPPIFNVSPNSAISAFPKIGYADAYRLLQDE